MDKIKKGYNGFILGLIGLILLFIVLPHNAISANIKLFWILVFLGANIPFLSIISKNNIIPNLIYVIYYITVIILSFLYINNLPHIKNAIIFLSVITYIVSFIVEGIILQDLSIEEDNTYIGLRAFFFVIFFIIVVITTIIYPNL